MNETEPVLPSWSLKFKTRAKLPRRTQKTNQSRQQNGPGLAFLRPHLPLQLSPLPARFSSTHPMAPEAGVGSRHKPEDKPAPSTAGKPMRLVQEKAQSDFWLTELCLQNACFGVLECRQIAGGWGRELPWIVCFSPSLILI